MTSLFNKTRVLAAVCLATSLLPGRLSAQTVPLATVHVTVVDPSGAVVMDATVVVAGLEPATLATKPVPVKTNDRGVATFQNLAVGRYAVTAEFAGFAQGLLGDVRLRAGENRRVVTLSLNRLEETVTAGDAQGNAAERRASEFGLTLSKEQIEALSDDPADLARQLTELAGPDAVIRVDSFEGQQVPPKAQIKSIHVTRDQFAAEAANPGSTFVDIVTQPGIGPIRGSTNLSFRDGSMNGRSRFTPTRQGEQIRGFGMNVGGTLAREKASFSLSTNLQSAYFTPTLNATLPDGVRAETLTLRQRNTGHNVNALVDYAATRDHTVRLGIQVNRNANANLGVGNYDLPERSFDRTQYQTVVRAQEAGPIGRRTFLNSRVSYGRMGFNTRSATDAPTVIVNDAFTSGGAQQQWDVRATQVTLASDLDHVRGIHSWRGGVQVDGLWFDSVNQPNLAGTFAFSSLEAYKAGEPVVYTQTVGSPRVTYYNLQGAAYFQDDIRIRRGFTLSPGVRYSLQKRISDRAAFAPRFGFTWAPASRGTTTLRGSAGFFHGMMNPELIEQTLRMNGDLQREIVVSDRETLRAIYAGELAATSGEVRPSNRYFYADDFQLQRNLRYSAGLDQVLSPRLRINLLYNYMHLQQQPRGRNRNAPVNGVRPDPTAANVIESVTDAEIRRHEVVANATMALTPPGPAAQQGRVNWRRLSMNASYTFVRAKSNGGGPWTVPPSGSVDDDWGLHPQDAPYRLQLLVTSTQVRNVTANLTYVAGSGFPYTWTTGFDDNRDGLVNDRPLGVGLRTLRGDRQQTLNLRVAYAVTIGQASVGTGAEQRYRLQMFANIQNVTNRQNLAGYSGVQTSPNFRKPTFVTNPRKVDFGVSMNF